MARGNRPVDLVLIIGAIAGERSERIGELIEKRTSSRAVVDVSPCQLNGNDLAAVAIDAEVISYRLSTAFDCPSRAPCSPLARPSRWKRQA
jgi:hypothetical protein